MEQDKYLRLLADYFNHIGAHCYVEDGDIPILMMPIEENALEEGHEAIPVIMSAFFANPKESFLDQMALRLFRISFYIARSRNEICTHALRSLFASINAGLPVGAYEADAQGAVYYAAGLPLPEEMDEKLFARQAVGAYAIMRLYNGFIAPYCVRVAQGDMGAKEAEEQLYETVSLMHAALRMNIEQQRK